MKHPTIIAGHHGLPPTSNIPWSATAEARQRREVLLYFSVMLITAATGLFLFLFRLWIPGAICFIVTIPIIFIVHDVRRQLYAMLLNKPRSTQGLTQWTEHAQPASDDPLALQYVCRCGRLVNMALAPYFPATYRFSVICECGVGHFISTKPRAMAAGPRLVN
jgi:hypothetical protein